MSELYLKSLENRDRETPEDADLLYELERANLDRWSGGRRVDHWTIAQRIHKGPEPETAPIEAGASAGLCSICSHSLGPDAVSRQVGANLAYFHPACARAFDKALSELVGKKQPGAVAKTVAKAARVPDGAMVKSSPTPFTPVTYVDQNGYTWEYGRDGQWHEAR